MAAAFDRAGFDAYDVHMSDLAAGRRSLARVQGLRRPAAGSPTATCSAPAKAGRSRSCFNPRVRDEFAAFFARGDTFALGVCNGCQMMSSLRDLIPGAAHWPRFVRNKSEQFEARFVLVEVTRSPSLFFAGMEGSRIPVATAHGEGYAEFRDAAHSPPRSRWSRCASSTIAARRPRPIPTMPTARRRASRDSRRADGRFTILMPHPERVHRSAQMSWHPDGWGDASPWMRMFRNARVWLG